MTTTTPNLFDTISEMLALVADGDPAGVALDIPFIGPRFRAPVVAVVKAAPVVEAGPEPTEAELEAFFAELLAAERAAG